MALPILTPEMRTIALARSAAARRERAAALRELTAGRLTLAAVLDGDEPRLQRAYVRQVLCALPGVGKVTTEKALAKVGIDLDRRVKGLGPRQRKALAEHFAA